MKKITYLSLLFCLLSIKVYCQTNLSTIDVTDPNTGKLAPCGPEGSEKADSKIKSAHLAWIGNPLKNRFDVPKASEIKTLEIKDLIATDAVKTKFTQGTPVQVTGYVYLVKPGDPESCNCNTKDETYKDTHIELTINSTETGPKNILIVEITPRMRELMQKNEDWSTAAIQKKYLNHMVTVQGWLFYDEEHENVAFATKPGNPKDWRASCWEVHPITSIAFADGSPEAKAELAMKPKAANTVTETTQNKTDDQSASTNTDKSKHSHCCWIAMMPIILFILAMVCIILILKDKGYDISDALKEPPPPAVAGAAPVTGQNSASRLIAFLTAVTTLIIVICVISFWMYQGLNDKTVDMSKTSTLLLSLGIGIVPYGVNKISTALKPSDN